MKRRLLIAAIFLLAGAVVNVAVAWVLTLRAGLPAPTTAVPDHEGIYRDHVRGRYWWCQVTLHPGGAWVVVEPADVFTRTLSELSLDGDVVVETTIQSRLYDAWRDRNWTVHWKEFEIMAKSWPGGPTELRKLRQRLAEPTVNPQPEFIDAEKVRWARDWQEFTSWGRIRSAFGWPMRAFYFDASLDAALSGQTSVFGGWRLPTGLPFVGVGSVLPYRLIPIGFTMNTISYATVLWLLIIGPFVLRRHIRFWQGFCPKCAYPMGETDVCSECGIALAKAVTS